MNEDFRRDTMWRHAAIALSAFSMLAFAGAARAGSEGAAFNWAGTYVGVFAGAGRTDNRIVDVDGFANWALSGTQTDERLTLQAALGMSANQNYLVSKRNLLVEGVHDYWIVPTATFMIGQELNIVALFDSDSTGAELVPQGGRG